MLCIEDAELSFTKHLLFQPFSMTLKSGDMAVLVAPSGGGKSTLLRWIAGIPSVGLHAKGRVFLNGEQIDHLPAEKRQIGLMFQQSLLFPHLNVADNLGFGLPAHIKGKARKIQIEEALIQAGLEGMGARDPETLSGGQQARIALMRVLLSQPKALLLDEPFSSLDDRRRKAITTFVITLARQRGLPVLLVSHDPRDSDLDGVNVTYLKSVE